LLDKKASRYVARVHRVGVGQTLLLFDPGAAREAEATVLALGPQGVLCRVRDVRAATRPARALTLLQGMGKGDKLDAIVRDATELGATRVVAVETARSVVRLADREQGQRDRAKERLARWRRIATEAARQCGRGDAPQVDGPLSLARALATIDDDDAVKLCLWERATDPIGPMLRALGPHTPLVVLIGPEGGLEEVEVTSAQSMGFVSVSLGPLVLRTETVAAAVLGASLLLTGTTA
jgi:16S rRNA (uracil1498-N3)-methyltransferase